MGARVGALIALWLRGIVASSRRYYDSLTTPNIRHGRTHSKLAETIRYVSWCYSVQAFEHTICSLEDILQSLYTILLGNAGTTSHNQDCSRATVSDRRNGTRWVSKMGYFPSTARRFAIARNCGGYDEFDCFIDTTTRYLGFAPRQARYR